MIIRGVVSRAQRKALEAGPSPLPEDYPEPEQPYVHRTNAVVGKAFKELFLPARYKVFWGGRAGAKSWSFARALVARAYTSQVRVLCAREYQVSIADSVHRLLVDQINEMGLAEWFEITQTSIYCPHTGSEFIFKGLRRNIQEIKSTEGIDICWVEEAQSVSKDSWAILIPTIRKEGSEIWISYNLIDEDSPTHQQFTVHPQEDSVVRKVGWEDNKWFTSVLDKERRHMLETDPEAYEHVWGGGPLKYSAATIFRNRYSIEAFEAPQGTRFLHGADWGFANDPTVLIRGWIEDNDLYIDQEAFGWGVEIDDIEFLFGGGRASNGEVYQGIETARTWPIKADNSRPETISYVRRKGFNIDAAEKWPGCVEDGVAHMKGFRHIHIHERCKHLATEFRLYSYKTDPTTKDVLPIIVDKHNHGIDSIRYSLDGFIQHRGGLGVWGKLVK